MTDEIFQNALLEAYDALESLLNEKAEIEQRAIEVDRQIVKLSDKVAHLAALCEDIPDESALAAFLKLRKERGLTEAVRDTLKVAKNPLTAVDVRNELIKANFDIGDYQNILATLHITLKRLEAQGEVEFETNTAGKTFYRWKSTGTKVFGSAPGSSHTYVHDTSTIKRGTGGDPMPVDTPGSLIRVPPPKRTLRDRAKELIEAEERDLKK